MKPTTTLPSLALLALFALAPARAQVPSILNYQGRVTVGGTNFNGMGRFKFALVNSNGSAFYWKNDGATNAGEPATAVSVVVTQGLYASLLGDTTISNMAALSPLVFSNANVNLRVWFSGGATNPFIQLSPDQRIAAGGYAMRAAFSDSAPLTNVVKDLEVTGQLTVAGSVVSSSALTLAPGGSAGLRIGPMAVNSSYEGRNLVGGDSGNSVVGSAVGSVIAGGGGSVSGTPFPNTVSGNFSAIGGGLGNTNAGDFATVAGGNRNTAGDDYASVGGGFLNSAANYGTVAGGFLNTAAAYAAVAGGVQNKASNSYSAVAGGWGNEATGTYSAVVGGYDNTASANYAFAAGGYRNSAAAGYSFVGGGTDNAASGENSFIGGGVSNSIPSRWYDDISGVTRTNYATNAFVGGGWYNLAAGPWSSVVGGWANSAERTGATVGGGYGNRAIGAYSTVPGGQNCTAVHGGSFVWSASSIVETRSFGDYTFTVRAEGGVRFYSSFDGTNSGVELPANAYSWASLSDREAKTDFAPVEPREVLHKLASLPVTSWHYKHDLKRRYIGPMAQDFHAAFGLGSDDKTISTLDSDGVMYAAIQGLVEELKVRDKTIEELKAQNEQLSRKIESIDQRLNSLPPAP